MIDTNKSVRVFFVEDPENRTRQCITSGDYESWKEAEESGLKFYVEYRDGSQQQVSAEDIDLSLTERVVTMNIVQQEVFVPLMESLLELMEESMTPAVSVLSLTPGVNATAKTVNTKFEAFKAQVNEMLDRYKPNIEES